MRTPPLLKLVNNDDVRPLLLTGGTVISMNPMLGDWEQADILIGGRTIVGVGPGLLTAAEDDGMIIVDCDYLDDLGFWAYGEFRDGELHHAGYRFTRH